VEAADITDAELWEDLDSDGATTSESQLLGYAGISISGSTGYTISTTTDFLIALTVTNLETNPGEETTAPITIEGSVSIEGFAGFEGVEGVAPPSNDSATLDVESIESKACRFTSTGNPSAVTHEYQ